MREQFLLGGVTFVVAAMIALEPDEARHARCARAEAHRVAARAAFDEGRMLRARREAQDVEAMCPSAAPALRAFELSAMVGVGECADAKDLARVMHVEAPPCGEAKPRELARDGLAALHDGDRYKAWQLFERALGPLPDFKAGERVELTGPAARFGHHVVACMSDGVVLFDLDTETSRFLRREGYDGCMLSPSKTTAWVNGSMVDVVNGVDLWSTNARGVRFSSDGAFFLERAADGTARLRNTQSGAVLGTFEVDPIGFYDVTPIGHTFQWAHGTRQWLDWFEIDVDAASLKRSRFVDAKSGVTDGVHRAVVDVARGAIVITNLATRAQTTIHETDVELMTFTPDGKTLLVQRRFGGVRHYDVVTGEDVLEFAERMLEVIVRPSSSSFTVVDGKREIQLGEIPITTGDQGRALLHAVAGNTPLPRDLDARIDASRLVLERDYHELTIRSFPRGRVFVQSEGLFDVVGDVPVKCAPHNEEPLPIEACDPRRTPGLVKTFLTR